MPYVYSTKTSATAYALYNMPDEGVKSPPILDRIITIKGGANLSDGHFQTPKGVSTKVSDEDLTALEQHPVFKRHCDRGFLVVDKKKSPSEKVAKDMKAKDKSAPVTPEKIAEEQEHQKKNR